MPYVDLHCADDYASIFYTTNSLRGNVGGFDPEKFGDPRLNESFNLISFDMRVCGRSTCRPSGRHDSWVEAADLAFCHQALHLPPCHVLALESLSIYCALRFAVLFPEMCLSLTLCNVPAPTELDWVLSTYDELMQNWCYAEDLETFEHVSREALAFVVGHDRDPDLQDDLTAFWKTATPPSRRLRIAESLGVLMNRTPLTSETYASITQPVLLIHGELNEICPKKHAEELASQLTNAKGGVIIYTVKGGSGTLSIVPGHASIASRVFAKFLSRLPHTSSTLVPPALTKVARMELALAKLAEIAGDTSIAIRDPMSSLSFSCLPPEIVKKQTNVLVEYRERRAEAYSPLGPDGQPILKYSDGKAEHWFRGEENGLSIAGTSFRPSGMVMQDTDRSEKNTSLDSPSDGHPWRAACSPSSVDKFVIESPMAKVTGAAPAAPFQRLLV